MKSSSSNPAGSVWYTTRPSPAEVVRELQAIRRSRRTGWDRQVIVHLDTSVLVDALTGPRRSLPLLERTVGRGHVVAASTLALFEWLRGPRAAEELEDQEAFLPSAEARPFGPSEAIRAAGIYRAVKRARGRDMDIAIAACAIEHGARLWT